VAKTIHSPAYAVLLQLLREQREAAGLRQVDVAERLGVHQSYVSKIEAGERRIDVLELREMCLAVGGDLPTFVESLESKLQAS
jgi:transcriptional regulator with XRE-family HTH domain